MSHLSKICPNCGDDGSPVDIDKALEQQRRQYIGWRYRLRMISYTTVTVLVAGVILWWSLNGFLDSPGNLASVLMGIGVTGYFVTRAGLFFIGMKLRDLRKKINAL